MLNYGSLEKGYAKYVFKHGLRFQKFISLFYCIFCYFSDQFHVSKPISDYYKHNHKTKNIIFCLKYYFYETLFILNYGWLLFEDMKRIKQSAEKFVRKNFDLLQMNVAEEKPSIIFTAHIGCFFTALFTATDLCFLKDKEILCIAPKSGQSRKDALEGKIRASINKFQIVDVESKASALKIARAMKNNGIIVCTMDFSYPFTKNRRVKFFGKELELPVGLLELGLKYDANMIPMFTYLQKGNYVIEFSRKVILEATGDKELDLKHNLSKIAGLIENKVTQYPEQWTMWRSLYYK